MVNYLNRPYVLCLKSLRTLRDVELYRRIFPTLFRDAAAMPPGLREHVRYPELLIKMQAKVYGLYHITDPFVHRSRRRLLLPPGWTVHLFDRWRREASP